MISKELLTEKQLCDQLGISQATVYRERIKGRLGYYRVAGKVKFSAQHIEDYLALCERAASRKELSRRAL